MPSAEVQAHLDSYGIDIPKVVQRYQPVASYDVQRVEQVTAYLAGLGIDVKRVVEAMPNLLAGRVEAYGKVVQLLRDNRIDVAHLVNNYPSVLGRRVATLQRTIDAIVACGHCAADVSRRHPSIFRCTPADISSMLLLKEHSKVLKGSQQHATIHKWDMDSKAALFSSLKLDADLLLKKAPQLLKCSFENLHAVVDYLEGLGVDVPKVAQWAPQVLGFRPESLQRRVQFLSENGFGVVHHVNCYPVVLALSVEQKLQPVLNFVTQEMGCPPSALNYAYHAWGVSLEGRLRPRFLYLQSLDKAPATLSSMSVYPDERFAVSLAKTNLQHYRSWRQAFLFLFLSSPALCAMNPLHHDRPEHPEMNTQATEPRCPGEIISSMVLLLN